LKARFSLVILATVLALTGCSASAEPTAAPASAAPSSTPAATPTPLEPSSAATVAPVSVEPSSSAVPVPAAPETASPSAAPSTAPAAPTASTAPATESGTLELSTESLVILAEDGTALDSFSYFTALDEATIAKLSAAIGTEPTVTKSGDDPANPDHVTYEWDGALLTAGNSPTDTEYANWTFTVSAATVGALDATTDGGIVVGSSRVQAEAAGAILDDSGSVDFYSVGATQVDRNGAPLEFCLYLGVSGDVITDIGGPAHTNRL
jgi:hypothetical protein